MRAAGKAIARQAGIKNRDLAAGTAELQGAGETGKAAADYDDVIHGDELRVVDAAGCAHRRDQLHVLTSDLAFQGATSPHSRPDKIAHEHGRRIEQLLLTLRVEQELMREARDNRVIPGAGHLAQMNGRSTDGLMLLEHPWQLRAERIGHRKYVAHPHVALASREGREQTERR